MGARGAGRRAAARSRCWAACIHSCAHLSQTRRAAPRHRAVAAADQHLEGTTKRALLENEAVASELSYHSAQSARLMAANAALRQDAAELRRQAAIAQRTGAGERARARARRAPPT